MPKISELDIDRINEFLEVNCTEEDDHDHPHQDCRKCNVMREELIALVQKALDF